MNKYIKKILTITIMFLIVIGSCTVISNALNEGVGTTAVDEFMDNAKNNHTDTNKSVSTVKRVFGAIRQVLQLVSITIAIVMLLVLAIKYLYSSVQERAEIKKHAVVYVIGAIIIFSVNGIIAIIQNFSTNVTYSDTEIEVN